MSIDYRMFLVPKNWNGDEDFLTKAGRVKKRYKQVSWRLEPNEKDLLINRVDEESFSFGGDGIDRAQEATRGRFLAVWREADNRRVNHMYLLNYKEIFQEMQDNLLDVDEYTIIKLRCFFRNVLGAISQFNRRVVLVAW